MRFAALALATVVFCALPAPAYYHYIHYINGASVPEKFDLTALPNKTLTILVSESGPIAYSQTDTFGSVLNQIRQATAVWNGIASSDLRVAFGGLENSSTPQNAPGGDVVFEDLPPGILAYGGPTSKANPVIAANGATIVPIVRSTVHFNRNMTVAPGPSFQETFFLTAVHELGHALGLQHTFTSAAMSQATTRSTNLSRPIDNDDVAGISVLYPNASFGKLGSIAGRITATGKGVHLASVVAIQQGRGAVSGVTNPDGSFQIDGIPPGQYYLYVHTMPPDADIQGPWNADGSQSGYSGPINTLFYPGTANFAQAGLIPVLPGVVTASVNGGAPLNIATTARSVVSLYDVAVYSYFTNSPIPVQPGFVDLQGGPTTVVAAGYGLGANGKAPGLGVQFIGNSAAVLQGGINPIQDANGYTYIYLSLGFSLGGQIGPQHMIYNLPGDMYVLPSGLSLTVNAPPTVTSATANSDGTVTVTGTNWLPDTRIYLDSLPVPITAFNPSAGVAVVQPPPGANGQLATVTAYNSDGQNSQLLRPATPVTYAYGNTAVPAITSITPSSLPGGVEAAVDITTSGFNFQAGTPVVGFGTSDVLVRRVFVISPNHVQVDVSTSANSVLSNPDISVISGFQAATAPSSFQITPAVLNLPNPLPVLTNALPGLTGAYPGSIVSLYGSSLAVSATTPAVSIAGQTVKVLYAAANQLNLQLPATLPTGAASLTINNGAATSFPLTVNIDPTPALLNAIQYSNGNYVDPTHPIHQGDLIIVTLSNFTTPATNIDPSRVQVGVGGVAHAVFQVTPVTSGGSVYQVSFLMNANDPVGLAEQLVVYLDGHSSYPATVSVAHQDGTFIP